MLSTCQSENSSQNEEITYKEDKIETLKLFIGGLNYITMKEDLKSFFMTFGRVTESNVIYNDKGRSKCFGFVTMEDTQEKIENIKIKIMTRKHEINGKLVDVKISHERELLEGSINFM